MAQDVMGVEWARQVNMPAWDLLLSVYQTARAGARAQLCRCQRI